MTQPPKPAPCVHCGRTEACHAKRGVDYINISDEGRCPRYRSIDGAQVGWLHTTYTPEPPAAEKLSDRPLPAGVNCPDCGHRLPAAYNGPCVECGNCCFSDNPFDPLRTTTPAPTEPSLIAELTEKLANGETESQQDIAPYHQGYQPDPGNIHDQFDTANPTVPSPDIIRDALQKAAQELLSWYGPFNPTKHPPEINGAWLRLEAALAASNVASGEVVKVLADLDQAIEEGAGDLAVETRRIIHALAALPTRDAIRAEADELPWCGLKVAFGIDDPEPLWAAHQAGHLALPEGWELNETDCSGGRCVAVFLCCDKAPTVAAGEQVAAAIRNLAQGGM